MKAIPRSVATFRSTFVKMLQLTLDSRHLMLVNAGDSRQWSYLRNLDEKRKTLIPVGSQNIEGCFFFLKFNVIFSL